MLCAVWYHLNNLKKHEKHPQRSAIISYVAGRKVTLLYGHFSRFLNFTNGTKMRKALHILQSILNPSTHDSNLRCSHRRSLIKKSVLKNFAKFIGKHMCQSLRNF